MIKIRVIRDTYDTTSEPASFVQHILWVGCIPSQIADLFPLSDDEAQDPLGYHEAADGGVRQSTRFEGFAEGIWYRIADPRRFAVPVTEEDLINELFEKGCPQCYTIMPVALDADKVCAHCEQENTYTYDEECEVVCFHCNVPFNIDQLNNDGFCATCETLIDCTECPYRFEAAQLIDGKCPNCHEHSIADVKLDALLAIED